MLAMIEQVVLADPGHGFGPEGQRCATNKRWNRPFDRTGDLIEGTVTIRVHFAR
jgi:hypothetical protein